MPTTYYTFTPQPTGVPFQFQPTLDGNVYAATVKWNAFGQRWYIALQTINGTPVFNQALVGSQPAVQIQSLDWENGSVTMVCAFPHTFKVGDTNIISVRECLPDGYNGSFLAYALDQRTLVYPLAQPPGPATKIGLTTYDINLAGGYFKQSTLVFRQGTQQFEVFSP
jgi:hypothetical protein